MSKKSTPSWPLFSNLHHWGHVNVSTVEWISVIVLGGTSLTVDLINLYDNNQFTIESCQIFPLLNEVTCKNFQGWGRWGGSMWLQLLKNYKWVSKLEFLKCRSIRPKLSYPNYIVHFFETPWLKAVLYICKLNCWGL